MCISPLKGFIVGKTENGKNDLLVTSYKVDHIEKKNGSWQKCYDPFSSPYAKDIIREYTEIPCGHCVECYLKRSRVWANRCMLEMKYHDSNKCWFLTLTYDDNHLPCGEAPFAGSLRKSDLQNFWKRLRDHQERINPDNKIKYFACGEYGPSTLRPHYHAIVFDLEINDLVFHSKSKTGFPLYNSEKLNKIWKNGYVVISQVTWETCAYVARYTLKKTFYDKEDFYAYGLEPEFVVMSQGIAKEYFNDNKEKIYDTDEIIVKTSKGGQKMKPPRYFDYLLEKENPDQIADIKENRKEVSLAAKYLKMKQTDLDYIEVCHNNEIIIKNRMKGLKRDKDADCI